MEVSISKKSIMVLDGKFNIAIGSLALAISSDEFLELETRLRLLNKVRKSLKNVYEESPDYPDGKDYSIYCRLIERPRLVFIDLIEFIENCEYGDLFEFVFAIKKNSKIIIREVTLSPLSTFYLNSRKNSGEKDFDQARRSIDQALSDIVLLRTTYRRVIFETYHLHEVENENRESEIMSNFKFPRPTPYENSKFSEKEKQTTANMQSRWESFNKGTKIKLLIKIDKQGDSVIAKPIYDVNGVMEIATFDFWMMLQSRRPKITIKRCENCHRTFIPNKGDAVYCHRLTGKKNQTCADVGAINNYKNKITNTMYLTIHKRTYNFMYSALVKPCRKGSTRDRKLEELKVWNDTARHWIDDIKVLKEQDKDKKIDDFIKWLEETSEEHRKRKK